MDINKPLLIHGAGGPKGSPPARLPQNDPEGVSVNNGLVVSLTQIEVLDLVSEGEIEGLVSGEYKYVGYAGQTGWVSADFTPYPNAPNTNANYLRSIFWNETPLVDSDNKFNFQSINFKYTPGRPNGSSSSEKIRDESTVTRNIGERLRGGANNYKTYRIINNNCKGIKLNVKFGVLNQTNVSQSEYGDVEKTTVDYSVYYRPLFSNISPGAYRLGKEESVTGNLSTGFINQTVLNFTFSEEDFTNEAHFLGWEIKIIRITPDSTTSNLRNQTAIDSLTEVYGNVFIYPNSAVMSSKFSAEYFAQIPSRAYDTKLLKVKIPSNYNPITKSYFPAQWDGTFADDKQWTDNPAWCYYDLLTNNIYGLGRYIDSSAVDKWTLYKIAQYCDVLVPDGLGGVEPRFTCNLLINTREEAYRVINDVASIFNAMTYYAGGTIIASQDSSQPKDDFFLFTNANVENGDFQYSSSSKRVRHTVAVVRYNDRTNFYKPAVESIEDIEGIKRYGIREMEVTAFGCTSRGQAIRLGRWALLTETLNTESINFVAGLEASYLRPGDVFKVFDYNRKGKRFGGRLFNSTVNSTGAVMTLDSNITGFNPNTKYVFSLLAPTYNYDPSSVTINNSDDIPNIRRNQVQRVLFSGLYANTISGKTQINFPTGFLGGLNVFDNNNSVISGNLVWSIEATGTEGEFIGTNQHDYFKVIRKEESQGFKYTINGISYNESKYLQIESGLAFEAPNVSSLTYAPNNLSLQVISETPNTKIINYSFGIPNNSGVSSYQVYVRNGGLTDLLVTGSNTYLATVLPANTLSGSYIPLSNGTYDFRVYSTNKLGLKSNGYANNSAVIAGINPLADVIISSLILSTGTGLNNSASRETGIYLDVSPSFKWQIGYQQNLSIPDNLYYRVTFRKPSKNNTPDSHIFYEVTGYLPDNQQTPSYQFLIDDNIASIDPVNKEPGPFREYDVVVEAMDSDGNSSAGGKVLHTDANYSNSNGYDILYVNNPRLTGIDLTDKNLSNQNLPYSTQQWATYDGDIKVSFSGFTAPDDIDGGYIYYSNKPFTQAQIIDFNNNVANPKDIRKSRFEGFGNPLVVSPSFTGISNGYMALSLTDTFDRALSDRGINIFSKSYISNVVPIEKRQDITPPGAFKAWINISCSPQGNITWENTSYNISSVLYYPIGLVFAPSEIITTNPLSIVSYNYIVTFKQNQGTRDYGVMISSDYESVGTSPSVVVAPPKILARSATKIAFSLTPSYVTPISKNDNGIRTTNLFIGILTL